MTKGTTIRHQEREAKEVKGSLTDTAPLQSQKADTAKQNDEAEQQKYKVVWWMVDPYPAKFTEVLRNEAEANAFARGLLESGVVSEDRVEVRKESSRAQASAA